MTRFQSFSVDQLPLDVREAWCQGQSSNPSISSPYFTLGFAEAMAAVRGDVRVLVQFVAGEPTVLLPLQKGILGHARPLGGPLGDHHGVVGAPEAEVDLKALLSCGGIQWFDFHGAILLDGVFKQASKSVEGSWVIDLSGGFDAFEAARTAIEPKAFRNIRSRYRKMEAAGFRVCLDDRRDAVFEQALAWKSAQYRASGQFDVFDAGWTRGLFKALRQLDRNDCQLIVSSLEIEGALAAVHIGMMSRTALHYWFPSYDPAQAKFGPGLALLMEIARAHNEGGYDAIHLGPGDYDFKAHLASYQIPLGRGFIGAGPVAVGRAACAKIEHIAEAAPLGRFGAWPGKAFRRIDKHAGFRAA